MTDHLPECPITVHKGECCYDDPLFGFPCWCDTLRACEERVAEETEAAMMKFFYWKPSPPHDKHYFADNICAYCVGRKGALVAAREALSNICPSASMP